MTELHSPASYFDMAQCVGSCRQIDWKLIKHQLAIGSSFSLKQNDAVIACAGIVPVSLDLAEVWFMPGPKAASGLLAVARATRLTLSRSPYAEHYALVRSSAGARLARLIGFERAGKRDGMEVWICRGCSEVAATRKP